MHQKLIMSNCKLNILYNIYMPTGKFNKKKKTDVFKESLFYNTIITFYWLL